MPARFGDADLIFMLQKAGRRINRRLSLFGTVNEIVVDATTGDMTPADGALQDLVLLQAECLVASREFQQELSDGTSGLLVKDGEQTLDTKGQAIARGTFFNSPNSPCEELKEAIVQYLLNASGDSARLVY